MEILGEFDNESPLYVSFCKRISPEDFERQSLTYTQRCLQDLYAKMEQNPGICTTVVRKRKQLENEEGGLASYLKTKFLSLFNYGNSLEMEEIQKEVEQLKHEMQRASNYASAAKRASQWPLERKPRKNIPLGRFSPSQIKSLDSAIPAMPRIFGPYPTQMERSTGNNTDFRQPWASVSAVRQKSMVDLHPIMVHAGACQSSFLESNTFSRPKSSSSPSFFSCRSHDFRIWFKGDARMKELIGSRGPCKSNWKSCTSVFEETARWSKESCQPQPYFTFPNGWPIQHRLRSERSYAGQA